MHVLGKPQERVLDKAQVTAQQKPQQKVLQKVLQKPQEKTPDKTPEKPQGRCSRRVWVDTFYGMGVGGWGLGCGGSVWGWIARFGV